MKIFIFTDIEGISGIYAREQVLQGESRHAEGRRFMTADINACARGCKLGGADTVVVRDGHGGSYSVLWDELSGDVDEVICGKTYDRFPDIDECDGVILLGYHAMAGTGAAVLEHSMSSKNVQNYWINGEKAGETAIDAAIVGEHGVPVIMVSGDDKVCAEAQALLPWIKTAQVKRGTSSFGAILLPPAQAHQHICDAAKAAVESIGAMRPFRFNTPIRFRVELTERTQLPNPHGRPELTIIDGRTYEVTADSVENALVLS